MEEKEEMEKEEEIEEEEDEEEEMEEVEEREEEMEVGISVFQIPGRFQQLKLVANLSWRPPTFQSPSEQELKFCAH
jgi:hypothetical protein